jgi:broad specificity phosphatase PhoE
MEIHLIRHGETNWNKERRAQGQSESHLTDLGIQQAKELGQRIGQLEFDKIYCSSSLRTRQTAEHAFSESTTEINYLDSLREIFLGPWEGVLYDEIAIREPGSYKHFWQEPHLFDVQGAESFFELQTRAVATVNTIVQNCHQQKVALVSHGALIKTLICHFQNRPISELWEPPKMHNCAHSIIKVDPAGVGTITQIADQILEIDG